jgi:hypothetical protein
MGFTDWQAYDHYLYAVLAVAGTLLAVAAIYWLMLRRPCLLGEEPVAGPFMNVVGVLFGLTLAFIANDTWSAHDRATNAVLQEADALHSLLVLAQTLEPGHRAALASAIDQYGRAAAEEWPRLALCATDPRVEQLSDEVLRQAAGVSSGPAPAEVRRLMLDQVMTLRQSRENRVGLSRIHVNPLKWMGMAFLGFLTLVSVATIHVRAPRTALLAMCLFALAAAPTAAIVLISGNPFQPPSTVSAAPLLQALGAG